MSHKISLKIKNHKRKLGGQCQRSIVKLRQKEGKRDKEKGLKEGPCVFKKKKNPEKGTTLRGRRND